MCIVLGLSVTASSQVLTDSVRVHFRQGSSKLDSRYMGNDSVLHHHRSIFSDNRRQYRLSDVSIIGLASPEGSVSINRKLSEERARNLFDHYRQYVDMPDSLVHFVFKGRDWNGLVRLVSADTAMPYQSETLELLRTIAAEAELGMYTNTHLSRLKKFRGGIPYTYMYKTHFPALRASTFVLKYTPIKLFALSPGELYIKKELDNPLPGRIVLRHYAPQATERKQSSLYMAIKTNLLYDAALIPNLGLEVAIGKQWSVAASWSYAWWKNDRTHHYWRTYGGDIEVRRWFGERAQEKPLQGHHVGLYAHMLTFDFELGGRGYLGDKWNYGGGISYGYSLPVAKRLNVDFSVNVGYLNGEYKEYIPDEGCYVWQVTKKLHWFGPTKADISLVWLIGRNNTNQKKGGKL